MPRGRIAGPLQFLTGGYASWLDTRQVELEGKTPREAVANLADRARVEAILRELERKERTTALSAFHLDEVRRELGLEPRGRDWSAPIEQTRT
jgi:hypothetical protein